MREPKLGIIEAHKATEQRLLSYFAKLSPHAIRTNDYAYVPGSTKMPLLVAHIDTVHKHLPETIYLDEELETLSSPQGLGADDRAGVYALAVLWENLEVKPGLLLCDGEESGGTGAWAASYELAFELSEYPFFVEIDRRGYGEAVFYNDEGQDFIKFIESFGFTENWGIFSDISILGEGLRRCSVNISAGYERNHWVDEYLSIPALRYTISHVYKLLEHCQRSEKALRFVLPKPRQARSTYGRGVVYHYNKDTEELEKVQEINPHSWSSKEEFREGEWVTADDQEPICNMCGMETDYTTYTNLTFGWVCEPCLADLEKDGLHQPNKTHGHTQVIDLHKQSGFKRPDHGPLKRTVYQGEGYTEVPVVTKQPPVPPPPTPPSWIHDGEPLKPKEKLTKSQARKRRKKLRKLARKAMRTKAFFKGANFKRSDNWLPHGCADDHEMEWRPINSKSKTPPPRKANLVERKHYNAVALHPELDGKPAEQTG